MLRISAYGQTGPYRDRPGFGRIANAFGGISILAGEPGRVPVTPGSATLADYLTGIYGAFGVMVALHHARNTGEGQFIDLGLYEPVFRILDELAPSFAVNGVVRERMGAGTVNVVPHSHYPTRDGRWIAIACTNDKMFERFAHLIGRPELAAPDRFGTIRQRLQHRAEVDTLVADWTSLRDRDDILRLCETAQVPCGNLMSIDEIFADPHYKVRGNLVSVDVDGFGEIPVPNVVPRLSSTPGAVSSAGPTLGAHNDEIYRGLLGLSHARLEELQAAGVI
jgi:succinyl-CoA:(S)-malate CoA-transferase subunit B